MVVCFGDSLTSGFQSPSLQNPTGKETPYGDFVAEAYRGVLEVRISGICGELTGEMVRRFQNDALRFGPSHVIILGGTNDLGCGLQPSEIHKNLVEMYEQSGRSGSVPIPVTVPSIRVEFDGESEGDAWAQQHVDRRRALNDMIQEYACRKKLPLVDLFTATAEPSTGRLAQQYSNDGIHLTTAGYRLFARILCEEVFAGIILEPPESPS